MTAPPTFAIVTRSNGQVLLEGNALPHLEGAQDFIEAARQLSNILGSEVVPLHQDLRYLFPDDPARQAWTYESLEPERVPVQFAWHDVEALELVGVTEHRAATRYIHLERVNYSPPTDPNKLCTIAL